MAKQARVKSQFVAFRAEPQQQRKLKALAMSMGAGSNMSAALRALVDAAPEPSKEAVLTGHENRQEGEDLHV